MYCKSGVDAAIHLIASSKIRLLGANFSAVANEVKDNPWPWHVRLNMRILIEAATMEWG